MSIPTRKPAWLRTKLPQAAEYEQVRAIVRDGGLNTVCRQANCPNQYECFSKKTATFLILGERCSRTCGYCAVAHGPEGLPDPDEPQKVAEAARKMGLTFVVVTSVTRDDLPDGGAGHFAATIAALKAEIPGVQVEVLIPDFQGEVAALETVLQAGPNVLNHNLETVARLYPTVRPEAVYGRSLDLLASSLSLAPKIPTKSGLMLGLGETDAEIDQTLHDLRFSGCTMLTLGQYLQPSKDHLPIDRYVTPEEFDRWKQRALDLGFTKVASGPLVRSSYHAETLNSAGEV